MGDNNNDLLSPDNRTALLDTIATAEPDKAAAMIETIRTQTGADLTAEVEQYKATHGTDWAAAEQAEKELNERIADIPYYHTTTDGGVVKPVKPDMPDVIFMDSVTERDVTWLVPGYIPRGCITLLGGTGGTGKGLIWATIAAAISTGQHVFFEQTPEEIDVQRKPEKVLYFSSEDDIEVVIKKRLRLAGANLSNVASVPLSDEHFNKIKFDSPMLENLVQAVRPGLIIFDPLQSFINEKIKMSERNAMRAALNPLVGLCKKYDASALIVLHTNKSSKTSGRQRLADSADIWDIARSVLIAGQTNDSAIRYLSHEKLNYGKPEPTALFTIEDNGTIKLNSFTDKKDYDFVCEVNAENYQRPARENAQQFIMSYLQNGRKLTSDLDEAAKAEGISRNTLARAKAELKSKGMLGSKPEGFGKTKVFYSYLREVEK